MAITRGMVVSVETAYLEANSSPADAQYLWAYRVTIENQGRETVQLLSRHWMITNAYGELTEVKGPGVVGEQPYLKPGESYAYTARCAPQHAVGNDGRKLPDGERQRRAV